MKITAAENGRVQSSISLTVSDYSNKNGGRISKNMDGG